MWFSIYQSTNTLLNFILSPFFLMSLLFWVGILVLIFVLKAFKKSKALSVFFPFLVMLKTKRLNKFIRKIAKFNLKIWKIIWTIGIFVSFSFTIYGLYFFTSNLFKLIFTMSVGETPSPETQVIPLVPGLTINFDTFTFLIIPILFVITTHELSHGISANVDNIPVKGTGVFGLGLFVVIGFGAFVEIDEKAYKSGRYSGWAKARLAGAGSFTNAILAVVALLIAINFTLMISPFWGAPNGAHINRVLSSDDGGHNQGILQEGDIIHVINGTEIKGQYDLSVYLTYNVSQNDTLSCIVQRNGENITLVLQTGLPPADYQNQSIAFIGITSEDWWPPKGPLTGLIGGTFPNDLWREIFWIWVVSISV
ncbi:MAG: site-2 protease family protein, partial [Promethearchaeota archaeon]